MTRPPASTMPAVTATRHPLIEIAPGQEAPPLPRTAWIEVDLDAVVSNVRLLGSLAPAGSRVIPVVKADAYGHGAVAVSRALVASGVESLAVATFDEGLELRQAGIEAPILVLFSIPAEMAPAALRHRLSITAGDRDLAERTLAALAEFGELPAEDRLAVHVELETGLGRGGIAPEDAQALARRIESSGQTRLAGVWTHLQAAGDAAITSGQRRLFDVGVGLIDAAGLVPPFRHVSASGGILAATGGAFDAVRIGLSIYGLVPDGLRTEDMDSASRAVAMGLRPAMALRARPIRVAGLPAGWGVSYGPTFRTARPSAIATLPVGYADGWPRSLSNKAQVLVRGRRAPQVGTVAMDALMVDVSDIPGEPVTIDDEFTLIGRQGGDEITAHDVALWGNTISYEVTTAMSGRLPRVYYAAAKPVAMRLVAYEAS